MCSMSCKCRFYDCAKPVIQRLKAVSGPRCDEKLDFLKKPLPVLLGSRVASILADIIVVVLTVVKAHRTSSVAQSCGGSLTQRIMRIFIQSGERWYLTLTTS